MKKTRFRYPHDLDKFSGDPAGEGGEYIDPTHLRLPDTGHEEQVHGTTGEGTCSLCHGRTVQPVQSRLASGDPPYSRCVNCGHEEDYPLRLTRYNVHHNGDRVSMTDSSGRLMDTKQQERMGLSKGIKERGR